jgi:hypothetical protein
VYVIKADGRREEFEAGKIIRTCIRAGAKEKEAEAIAGIIKRSIKEGDSTHKIYRMIIAELDKKEDKTSLVYRLREATAILDSISFELYVKAILNANGYNCKWDNIIKGRFVEHQVDIVAEKEGRLYLVECKHHKNHHRFCGLGNVLEVQARLEDIADGFRNRDNRYEFDAAWVITNTKFSDHAKKYAKGKCIRLTGWRSKNFPLEKMAEENKVFPITILKDLPLHKRLLLQGIVTLQDLTEKEIKGISRDKIDKLKLQAGKLLA